MSAYLLELKKVKCVHVLVLLPPLLTANSLSQVSAFCLGSLKCVCITNLLFFWSKEPQTRDLT